MIKKGFSIVSSLADEYVLGIKNFLVGSKIDFSIKSLWLDCMNVFCLTMLFWRQR